eukprot:5308564-Heterocapsa_arctica.AAC.1
MLDAYFAVDPKSKVACNIAMKDDMVMMADEITNQAKLDYDEIMRGVIVQIGWDSYVDTCRAWTAKASATRSARSYAHPRAEPEHCG